LLKRLKSILDSYEVPNRIVSDSNLNNPRSYYFKKLRAEYEEQGNDGESYRDF
jgi:hypothetical protein